MKLSLATLSLIEAAKNGRGGKHGKVDLGDNERFNWKTPKCIQNKEAWCTSENVLTENNGSIVFDEDNYKNFENHIYEIKAPQDHKIILKFDQTHAFGLEFHQNCGYDKLHIFKGNVAEFEPTNRIARFCGPKQNGKNGQIKPWDGAKKIKEQGGSLPMWDTDFDTNSNEVIVAVDFDQDKDGMSGFKLDWSFEYVPPVGPTECPDFANIDFLTTSTWAHEKMLELAANLDWVTSNHARGMKNLLEYSQRKAVERAQWTKRCHTRTWDESMSSELAQEFTNFCMCNSAGPNTLAELINLFMESLMKEYQGDCPNIKWWHPLRQNKLIGRMEDRLGDRWDKNDEEECTGEPDPIYTKPDGYTEHQKAWGTVYTKIYDDFYTMEEGQDLCAADAVDDTLPHMPIPFDYDQNDFFLNLVGPKTDRDLWLGINDKAEEGTWMNDLGDGQYFFNWWDNQPWNKQGDDEDNVEMILSAGPKILRQNGRWNDKPNNMARWNHNNNNMIVCTFTVPNSEPASECGYGWVGYDTPTQGRKCLQIWKGQYKIETAINTCTSQGAQLAQPQNESDNRFFADLIGYMEFDLWIGGECRLDGAGSGIAGGCDVNEWVNMHDGSALTYTNWNVKHREPNNLQGDKKGNMENYIQLVLTHGESYDEGLNGKWNDRWSIDTKNDLSQAVLAERGGIHNGQNNAFICIKDLP